MAISYWKDPKTGQLRSSIDSQMQNAIPGAANNTIAGYPTPAEQEQMGFAPPDTLEAMLAQNQLAPAQQEPLAADPAPQDLQQAPEVAQPDPWAEIAAAYGLGAPPAQALPTVLPDTQIGAAPQTQAALIDQSQIPQPVAQQMQVPQNVSAMSSGQGYSPEILAKMKAGATQNAANAGLQQLSQTKRILGQNGIQGGAAAAVQGDIARQTGQAQSGALRDIDINNAQVGNENQKFGIGVETNIGQNNMQAANAMALANANQMFQGLQSNQSSQNNANQMNTGLNFQRQENQAGMDAGNAKSQWDELNKRFSQSQNILGSWGAAA